MTDEFSRRLKKQGINLKVTEEAVDILTKKGFDPAFGARPLRRAVQSTLQNLVADQLLKEDFDPEKELVAEGDGEEIFLSERPKEAAYQL